MKQNNTVSALLATPWELAGIRSGLINPVISSFYLFASNSSFREQAADEVISPLVTGW